MSEDPDFEKREEERLMRNLNKKRNPSLSNIEEQKKKKEQEAKKKAELEKRKTIEEAEAAKKKAEEDVRKKKMQDYLSEKQKEEELAKQAGSEKKEEVQKHQQQQIREMREESAKREAEEQPTRNFDPKEEEEKLRKEAARMAKMFGGLGLSEDKLLSGSPSNQHKNPHPTAAASKAPTTHTNTDNTSSGTHYNYNDHLHGKATEPPPTTYNDLVETNSTNNFKVDEDEKAAREQDRIARQLSGVTHVWKRDGPSREEEEAREKEHRLRALKEKVELLGPQLSNDPKEFSKAFLNDPEMAARFKLASGTKAEHTLAGVQIPGGHEYK